MKNNYKLVATIIILSGFLVACGNNNLDNLPNGISNSNIDMNIDLNTDMDNDSSIGVSSSEVLPDATNETTNENNTDNNSSEENFAYATVDKSELIIDYDIEGPAFSRTGGCYAEEFSLEFVGLDNTAEVYYTIDGSDPVNSSTRILYEAPIEIVDRTGDANIVSAVNPALFDTAHCTYDSNTESLVTYAQVPSDEAVDKCSVIKAVYLSEDGTYSATTSQTYFIGDMAEHITGLAESCEAAGSSLAVISITMNYEDLFDAETGIYVTGNLFEKSWEEYLASGQRRSDDCGRKLEANYSQRGREWEREAYIDFYECDPTNMECVLSQGCGVRIQGNYSRSDLQKGFRVYARSDYGDKRFRYAIFGNDAINENGEVIDSYKSFVLRNGGNCAFLGKFNDTYWQSLVADLNCDTQCSRPAVVYLNGEYWGLYVLQEDYSSEYFEDTHGVDSSQVVLYKGDAERYASGYKLDLGELPPAIGNDDYYLQELYTFFAEHDNLIAKEDYEEFAKLVDVESCLDYFAVQCWINNKWDWPGKNWSMWRTLKPGEPGYELQEDILAQSGVEQANEYNDGRWRFCIYDVEFGGVSGESDAYTNTIKEDNYKTYGLLDMDTNNPAVLCFAYLMTNAEFRSEFYSQLNNLSNNVFMYEKASGRLHQFENIYGPLLDQFYVRYPGSGSKNDALYGGYGSASCIRDFLSKRRNYIQPMIDYAEETEQSLWGM